MVLLTSRIEGSNAVIIQLRNSEAQRVVCKGILIKVVSGQIINAIPGVEMDTQMACNDISIGEF